jgi:NADH-quinone oxidoreductase subunit A
MHNIMLNPVIVFIILFAFFWLLSYLFSKLAFRSNKRAKGTGESYACGEDISDHLAQPDYSQFFPYAFFFTIAHVATMMVTTAPMETFRAMVMAIIYILVVVIGLYILLRR